MRTGTLVSFAAASVALTFGAESLHAQRTRFPGDSPTRPAVMDGKVLGTPSRSRPGVPTFTISQGGFARSGIASYGYFSNLGGLTYGGFYPNYHFGAAQVCCPGCGLGVGSCVCSYPLLYPALVVDYRALYGFQTPAAIAAAPRAQVVEARAPIALLDRLPPAPRIAAGAAGSKLKKAWRYVDRGDRHLREGRLRDAHSRYRKAASAAPGLADVRFRQAFVELALGNVDDAAAALRHGLRLDPAWPGSGFDLKVVFSEEGQRGVLRVLADRLRESPNDADLRLLAGVMLHFGGDADAAQRQFERAVRVSGGESVARLFLKEQPEAKDAAALVE